MLSRSDLLTLLTINFIVVTKGAERISEVSARFTLDAMPGKQMAIDADLNAGLINQAQAQTRRKDVASEADFYGAMDGASKFVRGDAIAGMMILAINLIGGVCIGIFKYNLSADAAFQQYVLMTSCWQARRCSTPLPGSCSCWRWYRGCRTCRFCCSAPCLALPAGG